MSPQAGFVLLEEIAPRLRNIVPHIRPVGAEDTEELIQDALAIAAKMLHDLELRNKVVTPGNLVHYTVLHLKSGRRSYSAGRTDVMNGSTQLDRRSSVLSFEEPVGYDPETGSDIPLGELLSCHLDDPSTTATRSIDWEAFFATHNTRYEVLVADLTQGGTAKQTAARFGFGSSWGHQLKESLASDLLEFMGEDALADSTRAPAWRGSVQAEREKAACRADRRNSVTRSSVGAVV